MSYNCTLCGVCVCVSQGCFLLDAANFKLKERFSFAELQQITVSSRSDGIVLLRLPVEGPQARVRERERETHRATLVSVHT